METITLSYPSWYLLFSFVGGLLYSLFLYFRTPDFEDRRSIIKSSMAVLRFMSIAGIILLLLHPIIKSLTQTIKKPVIILARDNSSSMKSGFKNQEEANLLTAKYNELTQDLSKSYSVKSYSFGSKVQIDTNNSYNDSETNLSELFSTIYNRHNHENIGAILLVSDGLYNRGSNPLYSGLKLPVPIYSIGVGDTTERKDISIQGVFNNDVAYLNDQFTVNVDVSAFAFQNQNLQIEIRQQVNSNSVLKAKKEITISNNDFFTSVEFFIPATNVGTSKYTVNITPLSGEYSTKNNYKSFYIEVLDSRHRIQIIALAPHPDVGLLKTVLEQSRNNEVDISYIKDKTIDVSQSDLVIFHQLPGGSSSINGLISTLDKSKTPRWFILGSKSDLNKFNDIQSVLNIKSNGKQWNEVTADIFDGFNGFLVEDILKQELSNFPPLTTSFGEFSASPATRTFLFQKIHNVKTKFPLLSFLDRDGIKTSVLTAEGIWKWRLFNYAQKDNTEIIDELINSTIRYLSVKDDKSRFRVKANQSQYNENEIIQFTAEVYNGSFERDNSEEVSITIKSEKADQYDFTFSKKEDYYILNAGRLESGVYEYTAKTKIDNNPVIKSGKFSIQKVELEAFQHKANFALLSALSEQNGGRFVHWQKMDSLSAVIKADNAIKPIVYDHLTTRPLIDFKWPFYLLIILLSAEWFMRRYYGKY